MTIRLTHYRVTIEEKNHYHYDVYATSMNEAREAVKKKYANAEYPDLDDGGYEWHEGVPVAVSPILDPLNGIDDGQLAFEHTLEYLEGMTPKSKAVRRILEVKSRQDSNIEVPLDGIKCNWGVKERTCNRIACDKGSKQLCIEHYNAIVVGTS